MARAREPHGQALEVTGSQAPLESGVEGEGGRSGWRWRTAGALAAMVLGLAFFGALVLPGLRADAPSGPVPDDVRKLSELADERDDCHERRDRRVRF